MGSDPLLLAPTTPIGPLAWVPPYAVGVALEKTKRKKKKKKEKKRNPKMYLKILYK